MNGAVVGSKYVVVSGNTPHVVDPTVRREPFSRHSNCTPYSEAWNPKLATYQSWSFAGSFALKNGATRFVAATTAYHDYQTVPSDSDAEVIYAERVVPARIQAWVGGGIGLAAIVAGTGLWVTTSF